MARVSHRISIPTQDGLELAGILEIPEGERLGTILFSHCFTCSKDLKAIVRISRELANQGWIVLRYDFRGLGGSQGEFSKSNFSTNCQDLQAAAEFLAREYDGADFLMGHSFGGAASLAMAQRIESVMGVIALAAPSDTHHLAALLESMAPAIQQTGHGQVTIGGFTYPVERQMVEDFRSIDLPSIVSELRKPMLALHSPGDETVAYEHALRNCDFDNARSRPEGPRSLITLPNCNHLLTDERHCRWAATYISSWCQAFD
ncbi:alpha/beta hydrolase family protein [Pirellulaceae bacterium SH501]